MTPNASEEHLVAILREFGTPLPREDEVYDALKSAGVPSDVADRDYKFTLITCGRKFLHDLGIRFSDEFFWFNRFGDVMDSGRLREEPYYQAAVQLAGPESLGGEIFGQFAIRSADVQTVNAALNSGSKPSNLVTAPVCMFLEPPTESGVISARRVMELHMKKITAASWRSKPWLRLW